MDKKSVVVRNKKKGQGVVEYAGAMVVAALIVAAVIGIGGTQMKTVYTNMFTQISSFFTTQTANIK